MPFLTGSSSTTKKRPRPRANKAKKAKKGSDKYSELLEHRLNPLNLLKYIFLVEKYVATTLSKVMNH